MNNPFKLFKRNITIGGVIFLITIVGCFIGWKILVAIDNNSKIRFGNHIITEIETYKIKHGLPETNDRQTLEKFGFKDKGDFFVPDYEKIDDTTYELTYLEGFDGPYLLWNSINKQWKTAMPLLPIDTQDKVINLVKKQKIVQNEIKLIDSLSSGKRHITLLPTLEDTVRNIYKIKVGENYGTNFVTYFNFLVDANKMTILNPTGKIDEQ